MAQPIGDQRRRHAQGPSQFGFAARFRVAIDPGLQLLDELSDARVFHKVERRGRVTARAWKKKPRKAT